MVFQSYALFPHMTVHGERLLRPARRRYATRPRPRRWQRRSCARSDSPATNAACPSELSGGQQQRVAVARAIVLEPKVLLFDEPLSNLDTKLRRRVREEIRELQQSLALTAVYVTHDQQEALAISDRIMVMGMAHIAQDGSPRALVRAPGKPFRCGLHRRCEPGAGDDRAACRRAGAGPAWAIALTLPHRDVPAGAAELAIRPQAILLRVGDAGPNELRGRIARAAYLGSHMEYQVIADGLEKELFVIDPAVAAPMPHGTVVAAYTGGNRRISRGAGLTAARMPQVSASHCCSSKGGLPSWRPSSRPPRRTPHSPAAAAPQSA